MAASVKTNERPGTRAQVRYVRMSASKARVVLDLIRGKHVGEASQILAFSERLAAQVIMKCLTSAVANASHNDDIPAEELYIAACYADEGPTLKRFRPRARGRAGRIHKQTCHITIVVSRYDEDTLDELRSRAEQRSSGTDRDAGAERRRRVARSRAADQADAAEDTQAATDDTPAADTRQATDDTPTGDQVAGDAPTADTGEEATDDATADVTASDEALEDAAGANELAATEVAGDDPAATDGEETEDDDSADATARDEAPEDAAGAAESDEETD